MSEHVDYAAIYAAHLAQSEPASAPSSLRYTGGPIRIDPADRDRQEREADAYLAMKRREKALNLAVGYSCAMAAACKSLVIFGETIEAAQAFDAFLRGEESLPSAKPADV